MTKVKMDVMRPWIAHRVTELLGFEDEVLINFIYGLLEEKVVNGKEIQISLTGFMEKNTGKFMKELWTHLLSAQQNTSGVPQQFLDAKEEETKKKQEDTARITRELKRTKEKEEQERVKMDREADDVKAANLEAHPRRRTKFSSKWSADDKGTDERNRLKETARIPRSPHSADHSPSPPRGTRSRSVSNSFSNSRSHSSSRSLSASPKPLRHSASHERRSHSLSRRSSTPRRVGSRRRSPFLAPSRRQSPSPARRRLRSPSPASSCGRSPSPARRRLRSPFSAPSRGQSPSPARRRLQSPTHRRSRSPVRQRSQSPLRRRSRSPVRRRSRTHIRRSRTRTPIRRRSRTPVRRRSRTPIRRSRSPIRRRSRTPIRRRSRTPIRRRSRTPIRRRSRTPIRSPTPIQRRSRSPIRRRSSSPFQRRPRSPYLHRSQSTTSSSPVHSRSPSPVRRRSPSPMRRQYQKASRSPPPIRRQRSPSPGNRSSSPSGRSSVSPTRGTPPPLPKRGSPKREQRSSLWSSRDGHRDHQAPRRVPAESHSPVPVRSFEREPKGDEISHHGEPTLSPSLHKSRSSPSGESPLPPKRQRKGVITKDHLENVEVEGMTFSSKNDGRKSDPELSSDRVQDSEKRYKADEMNQEAVNMPKDQSGSLDSASEESDHKRKHKRKDVTSGDDNSHDSHAEDRKEAKRRRKEEKKLKKQEKRIRREERRRKKDIRRSEKLKLKAHENVSPSSYFDKSRDESALSDEKKLEIELREKALESLRAKKGVAR